MDSSFELILFVSIYLQVLGMDHLLSNFRSG